MISEKQMHKVYVSGALTNVPDLDSLKNLYEAIGDLCRQASIDAYVPHLKTDPVKNPDVTPEEVYRTDKEQVVTSDLVVAYVGIPSLGVGMELAYADTLDIPVVLLYEKGARVSRMARGFPSIIAQIEFDSHNHALSELKTIIQQKFETTR